MNEKYYKYANLLLKKGLCIKGNQPLVINAPIESIDFIRVLTKVACTLGINDIHYDWYDDDLKHTCLKYYDINAIQKSKFWNKEIHDEYAKKDAAFLFLVTANNNVMKDIDKEKLKVSASTSLKTRKLYREMQENNQVDWCIAAVATEEWGRMIFPNSTKPKDDLWETIFKICLVNNLDPCQSWNEKMQANKEFCQKLTNLNIKSLHYQNSLGTDLIIELSKDAIWCGGSSLIKGEEPIVNLPTEEVFTTPNKFKTNGTVYCSKPLIHSGIIINDIKLVFKDGKVISYDASSGKEELENILTFDQESAMLGEAALVDYNSPISNSNILFYETLYDENAACHIALGRGFKECLKNGENLEESILESSGYNKSQNHVDIMIGTKDLNIIAKTFDNKEIEIFKDGSFNL